jgi:hypothetical protein
MVRDTAFEPVTPTAFFRGITNDGQAVRRPTTIHERAGSDMGYRHS